MREIKNMNILNNRLVSLSNLEGCVVVEYGVSDEVINWMMDGGMEFDIKEGIEKGIKEVSEYIEGDVKENVEVIEDFKKLVEKIDIDDVERVIIWGVEYDVNVSIMFGEDMDMEKLIK
jgi:hypothetical protein